MEIFEASEILNKKSKHASYQCRMCQKIITKDRISISSTIRKKFLEVTQVELPISDRFSKFICSKCDKELDEAYLYRRRLIEVLMKQYNETGEVPQTFQPEIVNLKQEREELEVTEEYLDDYFISEGYSEPEYEDFQSEVKKSQKKSKEDGSGPKSRKSGADNPKASIKIDKSMIKDESGRTYFVCDYCGKNITTAFSLKEHILTQHSDIEKKFICNHEGCGRSYATQSRLRTHQASHRDDKKAICPFCGSLLYSKKGLREHIASVHTKDKKYFCDKCSYTGTLKSRIRSHVKVHVEKENRRNHACHLCGFVSICPKSLKRHLFEHQGVEYACHCGKVFNSKGTLQMHVRCVHKKIKPHVCEICGKPFFNKIDLTNHILVKHNADKVVKNIACPICGKLYGIEKQLQRHMLYHQIRYTCEYSGCNEYFNTEKRLQKHLKQHEVRFI